MNEQLKDICEQLLDAAKKAGASSADVLAGQSDGVSLTVRNGKTVNLERAQAFDVGLRAFVGQQNASVSTNRSDAEAIRETAERAVAMARVAPEDEFSFVGEAALYATDGDLARADDLGLFDPTMPTTDAMIEAAIEVEEVATKPGEITNSEGASVGWSHNANWLATSNGFSAGNLGSNHGRSVSVVAGEGMKMQRDYAYDSKRHLGELLSNRELGEEAAERTLKRLNPGKKAGGTFPVVFDPRVSTSILGALLGAINGAGIARGSSFLKDALGERVLPKGTTILDDPHRQRGLRSRSFDGEGLATREQTFVEDGMLMSWILDLGSAKKLGFEPTATARRGIGSAPGPGLSNVSLSAGTQSPKDLIGGIKEGFYVTDMMGSGLNMNTGDYSRGASGFWITNGALAEPVTEMTVAGNMKDMLLRLIPADDLEFRYGVNAPTLLIEALNVAGA